MNTLANNVQLIGNLGAQPEITKFDSGTKRARITIAVNDRYKNKSGEYVDEIQWHTIIGWGPVAERVEKAFSKGLRVMVSGKLMNRSYETKAGERRYATEIVMKDFMVLGIKPAAN